MSYRAVLSQEAAKVILRADGKLRARFQQRIHKLEENPFDPRLSSPLTGRPGVRKARVGDWRILFIADRERQILQIATGATRGEVYRR